MDKSCEETKRIWREADIVCFDVDSTICTDEGVDELAKHFGEEEAVKEWTMKAMGGSVTFQEAINARMKIINPSLDDLNNFINSHPPSITPGAKECVSLLQSRGCEVYLVSGGLTSIIEPVASKLSIDMKNVFANKLLFDYKGNFVQVDERQPTCRTGGKAVAVEQVKQQGKSVVVIGDGATDMEACPPADAFIGFGGNIIRDVVKEKASWFVMSFQELITEITRDASI